MQTHGGVNQMSQKWPSRFRRLSLAQQLQCAGNIVSQLLALNSSLAVKTCELALMS